MRDTSGAASGKSHRVAITTWFQYHNYGSALQVSALYQSIEKLGYGVDVVNYRAHGKVSSRPSNRPLAQFASKALGRINRMLLQKPYESIKREELFERYLAQHLTFTKACNTLPELEDLNDAYEVFVCGSDHIWAPSVFDSHYFLDFAGDNRLKISYAPSVGLPSIEDADVKRQVARLAGRIDRLSTREESGSAIISKLTGRDVATVLDPTLLLSPDEWRSVAAVSFEKVESNYLLVYMLGRDEAQWKTIYRIAHHIGLSVKIIPVFAADLKRPGCLREPVGPSEFVSLIEKASFVCTDSFHGVAFSLNFSRDFCVFQRFKKNSKINQNSRIFNILKKVGLEDRLVTSQSTIDNLSRPIAWGDAQSLLAAERAHSLAWLRDALAAPVPVVQGKRNITQNRSLCCGCSACETVCPTDAIEVTLNCEGFWSAEVDADRCISCGKCLSVCPFINRAELISVKDGDLYSYKNEDCDQLKRSSSGGAAAILAQNAFAEGRAVLGCTFESSEFPAAHRFAMPGDQVALYSFAGSKYAQSRMYPALGEAADYEGPLVIFGTPCQIAGARNILVNRQDVLYVDLICHGVPTHHLYERYLDFLEERGLKRADVHTEFRYKPKGWREIHIYSTDGAGEVCSHQRHDPYFLMFEAGHCYARSCYECPWRDKSAADVRLGDYWGPRFEKDSTGVSMVLALTNRGKEAVEKLADTGSLDAQPVSDYLRAQQMKNFPEPVFRDILIERLGTPGERIDAICESFAEPVARERDARKCVAPFARIAKRLLGRS